MTQFRRSALLGATTLSMLAVAAAPGFAFAQADAQAQQPAAQAQPQEKAKKSDATSVSEIVVTGSRIKQREFTGPSPITVITSDENDLKGAEDTVAILQLSTVAANAVQINNEFTGFVTTGGPGADTLSLRGIGAQRTLILLDGQRMGPAGIGGTVGPVDLNTIPASDIDHVEVLKDGASSIYGSDAIAGVVNIITKTKLDGIELQVFGAPTQHGGGNQYQISAGFGKTFDKGFVHAGFDFYRQDPILFGQRPYFACARDVASYPTGGSADLIDPSTGQAKCYNQLTNTVVDLASNVYYRSNPAAVFGGGPVGADLPGWQAVDLVLPSVADTRASHAILPYSDPRFLLGTALSPVSRYSFTLNGAYDLTPHVRVYGSFLYNRRDSEQTTVDQFFTYMDPGNPFNTPGFGFPLPILEQIMPGHQTVNYFRAVVGAKGDLPTFATLSNWTYDVYGQFSRSDASYDQRFVYADRVNATAGASTGTNGCDVNANIGAGPFTMAQAEPGVACVPVDYISAAARGSFLPQEEAFLYFYGHGTTVYNHYYVEGSATGDLFKLPAGNLSAALGFQLRKEELDDRPPADVQDGNVFNYSTVGRTKGTDTIEEIYGELQIPVLAGLPGVRKLQVNLSGRGSHYASYGYNGTYKAGVEWQITDWLTARGSYGTAFRAPALYELYLADQTSYLAQLSIDPCINYGTSGVSLNVQKNCAAQGLPSNYNPSAASATVLTGGGKGNLKPETSIAQTAGIVFRPKWWGLDLELSADYYNFTIDNQIQEFGASNIIYQCYNSSNFPANPFCGLFTRDLNPSSPTYQSITNVNDNYVNVARQVDQGLDVTGTWKTKLPKDVKLTVDANLAWTFYTNTILLNGETNNYLGQVGQPSFVGDTEFKFERGPWTLNYDLFMVGKSSDNKFISNEDLDYHGTGQTVLLNHTAPFYTLSNVAIRRKYDKYSIEFGVRNVADAQPPVYSAYGFQSRLGTFPLTSQYDVYGRTFYFLIKGKF